MGTESKENIRREQNGVKNNVKSDLLSVNLCYRNSAIITVLDALICGDVMY